MRQNRREIYFEHYRVGTYVKVSAIDGLTRTEVSITGPVGANPRSLEKLALKKLQLKMKKDEPPQQRGLMV